jgi:hypothetical protein
LRIEGVLVYSFAIERYINFKFCDTTRVGPKRATARAGTTPLSGSQIGGWGGGGGERRVMKEMETVAKLGVVRGVGGLVSIVTVVLTSQNRC